MTPVSLFLQVFVFLLSVAAICASPFSSTVSAAAASNRGLTPSLPRINPPLPRTAEALLSMRGGGEDDEEYVEEDESAYDAVDNGNDNEDGSDPARGGGGGGRGVESVLVKTLSLFGRAMISVAKSLGRALEAGVSPAPEEDDDEINVQGEVSLLTKVFRTVGRMWDAAVHPKATSASSLSSSVRKKASVAADDDDAEDVRAYLTRSYGVRAGDDDEEGAEASVTTTAVLGGSFSDALREARRGARLVVTFIPATKPPKKASASPPYDRSAVESLLSVNVSAIAERNARKKQDGEYGSFVLWAARHGSAEARDATKRLKAKKVTSGGSKGKASPILAVAYAAQMIDASGRPKLVPRLLAQHHCNPPPSAESMAAWLNALRKRHAKQYAAMQHDLREARLFKERQEGYQSSAADDAAREEEERRKEEERKEEERAERERLEGLTRRREELLASLPPEPDQETGVGGVMTIALRFADGRTGQRRFEEDAEMAVVFNWVDAMYGMERERVVLTTMNGQRSFTFQGSGAAAEGDCDTAPAKLKDSGLGRMTGLRVTEMKDAGCGDEKEGDAID